MQIADATTYTPQPSNLRHLLNGIGMGLVHLSCFAAIWTGVSWGDVILCFGLVYVRMFGVTAGYHRYFSHRTYKTNRFMQFLLAFLAMSSAQKGVLWWAAHHRHHHRFSDHEEDVHSPLQRNFWWAHIGWILSSESEKQELKPIADFAKYPELRWLERWEMLPPFLLGLGCFLAFGWSGLVVGFCWSTVMLWHQTFFINSLAHIWGTRRFETTDGSRNNFLLALITLGEGWHNNHHHFPASTRQGFRWWEIDITYYVLRMFAMFGLVWDIREPPTAMRRVAPRPAA